jgi:hypothetical protein
MITKIINETRPPRPKLWELVQSTVDLLTQTMLIMLISMWIWIYGWMEYEAFEWKLEMNCNNLANKIASHPFLSTDHLILLHYPPLSITKPINRM